jgi:hypothetical protein
MHALFLFLFSKHGSVAGLFLLLLFDNFLILFVLCLLAFIWSLSGSIAGAFFLYTMAIFLKENAVNNISKGNNFKLDVSLNVYLN